MTQVWLISKARQKPFSTSKFTDSHRSNLLCVSIRGTVWVNKGSCMELECALLSVWAHLCEGQRLNKDGTRVCVTLVISLSTQTEMWWVLVKLFFPSMWGKKNIHSRNWTRKTLTKHTHTHTLLLYIPQGYCACHILSGSSLIRQASLLHCAALSCHSCPNQSFQGESAHFLGTNQDAWPQLSRCYLSQECIKIEPLKSLEKRKQWNVSDR